ncbi:MAG: acyl-CoA dehydrogenase family protein [Myxococcota bacterium]|nr:acyl-CoA dehydrogenase family protein [Myxococcota bacterium]
MSTLSSTVEDLLDGIAAHASHVDATGAFPTHTLDALREAGLLGLVTPTEHGGQGGTLSDAARVVEAIGRVCGSSAMVTCMHYAGALVLAKLGPAEINRDIAEGRHISTLAFSEAGSRSHFWAPLSTATVDGEQVVLDARKSWVTSAHHATAYVWSSQPLGAEGASTLWLVPRESAGLQLGERFEGLGLRGNDSVPVKAEGVRVPAAHQLGEDGAGFDHMMGIVLPAFQLMNAAASIGATRAALKAATEHVAGVRFGHLDSRLCELPTIRAYLAKAQIQADSTAALWEDALQAVDSGRADAMLRVLQAKAAASETSQEVTATCMRICGGAAFRKEVGVERNFRDAQAAGVMAPTSDVLYDFIGKALCGMPLF